MNSSRTGISTDGTNVDCSVSAPTPGWKVTTKPPRSSCYFFGYPTDCARMIFCCDCKFRVFASIQGHPIISGDAAATAKAISASQEVFRLGVSLELIATLLFLLTAWSLYVLFRNVHRNLALLFLVLNLVGVAIESVFALIHFAALSLCDGSKYLGVFPEDQLQALAMLFLNLSDRGNMVTVLFYGAWLFPLGYLALQSRLLPRFFGILLILDGISLMICFFQLWLLPGYQKWTYPLYPVMFVAEFGFGLWLAVKGVQDGSRSTSEGRQAV